MTNTYTPEQQFDIEANFKQYISALGSDCPNPANQHVKQYIELNEWKLEILETRYSQCKDSNNESRQAIKNEIDDLPLILLCTKTSSQH